MDVRVTPSRIEGCLQAPPSKSAAHRALICAGLCSACGKKSRVLPLDDSEDMRATLSGLAALGVACEMGTGADGRNEVCLTPSSQSALAGETSGELRQVDCGESGSTYRFFLPILGALGCAARFTGRGKLPERPMEPMFRLLEEKGLVLDHPQDRSLPLTIGGRIKGGIYEIRGDLSSQYITGLLFALPLLPEDSQIRITTRLESAPYVEMTLDLLAKSGIRVERTETGFFVPGGQTYKGGEYVVEGDYSNAAFHLCAGAVAGAGSQDAAALGCGAQGVTVTGLSSDSAQGDRRIVELLSRFGAAITVSEDGTQVRSAPGPAGLVGIEIDAGDIPDLVPVLAATAVYAKGTTVIYNAGRLRIKESDRLAATCAGLTAMGASVEEGEDRLVIHGGIPLRGGVSVSAENDHRIAMAMSVAALGCREPVVICGAECVRKSYPGYFGDLNRLGGKTDVIDLGE